jgi:hypothetical protein
MSISTGLDWTGNLSDNADKAASSVDRLVQSLRALQSIQGKAGPTSAGLGGVAGGGIGGIGAAAKEANKAVLIQTKSAADLAKIDAKRIADLDVITAKQKAVAAGIAGQVDVVKQRGTQAQALEGARAASKVAAIQAQSDADRNRAIGRVVEGQAKAASAIAVEQNKSAQAAIRATEKAALVEQQGAIKSAQIRAKSAADLARIEAKKRADMARDTHRASLRSAGGAKGAVLDGAKGAANSSRAAQMAAVGDFAINAGRAAFNAAKQIASITLEFGTAVVQAQAFKEDIYEAFKTVRGTNDAADKTFQVAIANADKLGIKRADSIGQFLDLATKGFDDAKIKEIQGRLLDITTIDPRASIEGLTKVIGKIQATGRLNQETLNELSTFGLEQGDVIKQVGKALGKSDAEVLKTLSSSGGLRDKRNVDFVLAAIAGQTGGGAAGDKAAEKANRNLSSLIRRVSEVPQNVLFDLEVGPGVDAVKSALKAILDFFAAGSDTAKRASAAFGNAFNALLSGLTGEDIKDTGKGIAEVLDFIVFAVEGSAPTFKAIGSTIRYTTGAFLALSAGIGGLIKILTGDFSGVSMFFSDLSTVLKSIAPQWMLDASSMGSFLIDGLVNGITAGANRVVAAVKNVASSALTTAKTVLGIASPSKETHAFGEFYSIGMGDGIENKADYVSCAARLMAEDALVAGSMSVPRLGASPAATSRNGVASGERRVTIVLPPGPLVQIVAGPGTNVAELLEQLEPGIRALFIRIMQQVAQEA